jgi:MEMO1 family protein
MNHHLPHRSLFGVLLLAALLPVAGCRAQDRSPAKDPPPTPAAGRVREPAVAGLFYPLGEAALTKTVDDLLRAAPATHVPRLKALVCPHAGYRYSGPCAAVGYKLLTTQQFNTVVLLAPSHYAAFTGASVSAAATFKTPLGSVPIAPSARTLAARSPFVLEPRCFVQRPSWAAQSSRALPPEGEDTPDTWEHSDEVQVPFLQRTLKQFNLLPIVLGEVDPAAVAKGLAPLLNDQTLLVASSDLSHYHPYDSAKDLDAHCVAAITNLDLRRMRDEEACGKTPILTLMNLAVLKGWKARLLDYRNSGDATGDKRDGVVGYAAVAFYAPGPAEPEPVGASAGYSREEKKFLIDLAKRTVRSVLTTGLLPAVDPKSVPPHLLPKKACFVTLTKHDELRGCIGHILPQEALYQAVMDNARSAALQDYRFPRVEASELPNLQFEISILTEPVPLNFTSAEDLLNRLRPSHDGLVLKVGGRSATFLPQVWEQLPDKTEFLNRLCMKAGAAPGDWRKPGTEVSIYHVEAFKESDL